MYRHEVGDLAKKSRRKGEVWYRRKIVSVGTWVSKDSRIGGLQVINSSNGEGDGRVGTVVAIMS